MAKARRTISQNRRGPRRADKGDDEKDEQDAEREIDEMLAAEHHRRAGDEPLQLGEGNDRAGEGEGADGGAERHLDQAAAMDVTGLANAEGMGRI